VPKKVPLISPVISPANVPLLEPSIDINDPQYRKIFVGGLPHNLALCDFRAYFQQFGVLEDCVILKDKRTQKPRGFGFVTYSNISSVTTVMQMKNKHIIQGKWVDCKSAIPINEMKLIELKSKGVLAAELEGDIIIPEELKEVALRTVVDT